MPFYVHRKDHQESGSVITQGESFTSREAAHKRAEDLNTAESVKAYTFTFIISDDERDHWERRERNRMSSEYLAPPWTDAYGYPHEPHAEEDRIRLARHFAHLSLKTPGSLAYTPSEEHGYQDRQVTVKVGRYLEQFYSEIYTVEERNDLIAAVKAINRDLQIARSTEDIIRAYTGNRHNSCMGYPVGEYTTGGVHPVSVYGDSDLAVAYLGDIDNVTARCVVWPDKKLYCRIYGDPTLAAILKAHGYTIESSQYLDYGSLAGAKIHAIPYKSTYIMPYVDGANTCDLVDGGKHFKLHANHDGEYTCRSANYIDGLMATNDDDEAATHECANCCNVVDEDQRLCDSCEDDLVTCSQCGRETFNADFFTEMNGDWYCSPCVRQFAHTCAQCDSTWHTTRYAGSLCEDCEDNYTQCDECEHVYANEDAASTGNECPECNPGSNDDDDDEPIPVPVVSPFTVIRFTSCETHSHVPIIISRGFLALHRTPTRAGLDYSITRLTNTFSITHLPTGLAVKTAIPDEATGRRMLSALHTADLDWSFKAREGASAYTRQRVRDILSWETRTTSTLETTTACEVLSAV